MALEVKAHNGYQLYKKYQQTVKKKINRSQQIYVCTHTHLKKEQSVELGRDWLSSGERFGQLDKPWIFTTQGSYGVGGRPGRDKVRQREAR